MVEATRLMEPQPLLKTEWVKERGRTASDG